MASASEPSRDWLELPSEVTTNILQRIGVVDILENARRVCTTWRKICKEPAMWRVINMNDVSYSNELPYLKEMCKNAVDRSQGQLVDITIVDFGNDELLLYVARRSSQLRRLEVAYCFDDMYESWTEALKKFPLLEELGLFTTKISKEAIETAGRCCPMLKTLKVNQEACKLWVGEAVEESIRIGNELAVAIGENLHELRHLELIGSKMSNIGLQAILDGCPHLESLDLRYCWHIDLKEDLMNRCSGQIKHLKLPNDSLENCRYLYKNDSLDDTTKYGLPSDMISDDTAERGLLFDDFDDDFEDFYDEPPQFNFEDMIKVTRHLDNILRKKT